MESSLFVITAIVAAAALLRKNPVFSARPYALSETSSNYRMFRGRSAARFLFALVSVFALAFHATGWTAGIPETGGRDVAFLLDVSRSMDAPDAPDGSTRLEAAKRMIERTVREHPENRYALFALGATADAAIPATSDAASFSLLLSGISSKYSGERQGTDLTKGVAAFAARLAKGRSAVPNGGERKKDLLAVVFSDGGDGEDTPKSETLRSAWSPVAGMAETLVVGMGSER